MGASAVNSFVLLMEEILHHLTSPKNHSNLRPLAGARFHPSTVGSSYAMQGYIRRILQGRGTLSL